MKNLQPEGFETLSLKMIEGGRIISEYANSINTAMRSTDGKGIECTKYAYSIGMECFKDTASFKALLDLNGVKLRGGFSEEKLFYATLLLFIVFGGKVKINLGEVSRIAAICNHARKLGVTVNKLESFIEQMGGLRAIYNSTVTHRKIGPAANDNEAIDNTLRLEVHCGTGFRGILNLSAKEIAALISRHGFKSDDDGSDPTPPQSGGGGTADIPNDGDAEIVSATDSQVYFSAEPSNDNVRAAPSDFTFSSSFACAGGADYGMKAAGARLVYANEFRTKVARLHELNHGLPVDTRSISETEASDYSNPTVMVGGFPCQPFSIAGKQMGNYDPRGEFGPVFARKIMDVQPAAFICENVPPFLGDPRFSAVFQEMMRTWGDSYSYGAFIFNAADYGVPQTRERAFIVGYHADLGVAFNPANMVKVEKWATLWDGISDLNVGQAHVDQRKRPLTGWEYSGGKFGGFFDQKVNCLRNWDAPSYTIVSHVGSIPLHPEPLSSSMKNAPGVILNEGTGTYHRRLTIRECARIQTFPDSFDFGDAGLTLAHDVVGNAIPPMMMRAIGDAVRQDLTRVGIIKSTNDNEVQAEEVCHD